MSRRKITITLAVVYALVLFTGLTLWRLPMEGLIAYLGESLSKGRLFLKVEKASTSFPFGFNLEKVSYAIIAGDTPLTDRLDRLSVAVNPFLLIVGSLPVSFRAHPAGGAAVIRGSGSIPLAGRNAGIEITASDVELGEMTILKSLAGRELKGKAGGDMKLSGNFADMRTLSGRGSFIVQKGSMDTKMDVAGLKTIPFESVRFPFTIKDGQLSLDKAEMEGPMLSGTLAGQVKLNKVLGSSTLDLTAKLKPGPLFNQSPLAGIFLSKIKEGSREITLKIGGSIKRPSVVMEK